MSTREFPGDKCGWYVRLTTLPTSCAVVMKSGNLNFLEPSGPLQACNGTAFTSYPHPVLPSSLPSFLPSFLPPFLPSSLPSFLPSYPLSLSSLSPLTLILFFLPPFHPSFLPIHFPYLPYLPLPSSSSSFLPPFLPSYPFSNLPHFIVFHLEFLPFLLLLVFYIAVIHINTVSVSTPKGT